MSAARYFNPRLRPRLLVGDIPKWLHFHPRKGYILQAILSAPPWVDRKALYAIRDQARWMTVKTGVEHVMAHIVPLNHPYVCGLTVPWNFKVVPRAVNAHEGNKWHPDQLELEL